MTDYRIIIQYLREHSCFIPPWSCAVLSWLCLHGTLVLGNSILSLFRGYKYVDFIIILF